MHEGTGACIVKRCGNVGDAQIAQPQQLARCGMAHLVLDRLEGRALALKLPSQGARVQAQVPSHLSHSGRAHQQGRAHQMPHMRGQGHRPPGLICQKPRQCLVMQVALRRGQGKGQGRGPQQQARLVLAEADRAAGKALVGRGVRRRGPRHQDFLRPLRPPGQLGDQGAADGQHQIVDPGRDPRRGIIDAISQNDVAFRPHQIDGATRGIPGLKRRKFADGLAQGGGMAQHLAQRAKGRKCLASAKDQSDIVAPGQAAGTVQNRQKGGIGQKGVRPYRFGSYACPRQHRCQADAKLLQHRQKRDQRGCTLHRHGWSGCWQGVLKSQRTVPEIVYPPVGNESSQGISSCRTEFWPVPQRSSSAFSSRSLRFRPWPRPSR